MSFGSHLIDTGEDILSHTERLLDLPLENVPRLPEERRPTKGYYVAMVLVFGVWMITPLSCAYVLWFVMAGRRLVDGTRMTATIFATYCLTEALFAIYHHYLVIYIQTSAPPSTFPLESRNQLFLRILQADVNNPFPSPPLSPPKESSLVRADDSYESGLISGVHHVRENGIQRVGSIAVEERKVINSSVEEEESKEGLGPPEQVRKDTGVDKEVWREKGFVGKFGNAAMLHQHDARAVDFRERMRTWFDHAPWSSIRRENILVWLSWSCFNLPLEQTTADPGRSKFLQTSLEMLQAKTGTKFREGFDPTIRILRLTMDPVNAKGRPIILYAFANGLNWWLRRVVYRYQGMRSCWKYTEGGLEYLIRIPKDWTPDQGKIQPDMMPVVYLHGLGFGLLQNHLLIKHLNESLPSHPIVVPLAPYISHGILHPRFLRPWTRVELVDWMRNICRKWGFWEDPLERVEGTRGGISLLSHSNGSVAHGWILKDCPSLIRRSTFVDPIVFCLWEGDVCRSFCYRKPASGMELLLYYFVACEVGIGNYIQRNFDWADNTLFVDEIPNAKDSTKTAFFLGGRDIILDAARIKHYLENNGISSGLHWDANGRHGDCLAGSTRDLVVMFAGTGSTRVREDRQSRGKHHSHGKYFHTHQLGTQSEISWTETSQGDRRNGAVVGKRKKDL